MFGMGWGELLVLALVGLFVLGPERLPGAVRWSAEALRRVRGFVDSAKDQLDSSEFDELRRPLADLREPLSDLRDARTAVRDTLRGHLTDPVPGRPERAERPERTERPPERPQEPTPDPPDRTPQPAADGERRDPA